MRKFRTNPGHQDSEPMMHLRARHGAEGYGIYIMLLNLIAASPTRSIDTDAGYLAYVLRVDQALIRSILFDFELFTISPDKSTATSPLVTPPAPKEPKAPAQAPQSPKATAPQPAEVCDSPGYIPSDATRAADAVQLPEYTDFIEVVQRNNSLHPKGIKGELQCQFYINEHPEARKYEILSLRSIMADMYIFFAANGIEGLKLDYILHRSMQYYRYIRA